MAIRLRAVDAAVSHWATLPQLADKVTIGCRRRQNKNGAAYFSRLLQVPLSKKTVRRSRSLLVHPKTSACVGSASFPSSFGPHPRAKRMGPKMEERSKRWLGLVFELISESCDQVGQPRVAERDSRDCDRARGLGVSGGSPPRHPQRRVLIRCGLECHN